MASEEDLLSTPSNYATPEQLKSVRSYAEALLYGKGQQPVQHWTQGLSNMISALVGGYKLGEVGRNEAGMLHNAANQMPVDPGDSTAESSGPPLGMQPSKIAEPQSFQPRPAAYSPAGDDAPIRMSQGTGTMLGLNPGEKPVSMSVDGGPQQPFPEPVQKPQNRINAEFNDLTKDDPVTTQALAFNGEPASDATNAPEAISRALALSAGKGPATAPATPNLGVGTRVAGDVSDPTQLTGPIPHRVPVSRQQLMQVLSNPYASPEIKKFVTDSYYAQRQPIEAAGTGGKWMIDPTTHQTRWVPDLQKGQLEAGDIKYPYFGALGPDGKFKSFGGPAGESGEGGGIPAGMKKMYKEDTDLKSDREAAVEGAKKGVESYTKLNDKVADAGREASTAMPMLEKAKAINEHPKMYSGPGADAVLLGNQMLSILGGDPTAAANMSSFTKIMSGQQLSDLKSKLEGLGQVRVAEMNLIGKASANIYNTRAANRAILDVTSRTQKLTQALAREAQKYNNSTDRPTNIGLQSVLQKYIDDNPMYTEDEIKNYTKLFEANEKYAPKKKTKPTPSPMPPYVPPPVTSAPSGGGGLPPGFVLDGK